MEKFIKKGTKNGIKEGVVENEVWFEKFKIIVWGEIQK